MNIVKQIDISTRSSVETQNKKSTRPTKETQNEITPTKTSENLSKATINSLNTQILNKQNKTDCKGLHSTSYVVLVVILVLIAVLVLNIVLLKYLSKFYDCRKTDIGSSTLMLMTDRSL